MSTSTNLQQSDSTGIEFWQTRKNPPGLSALTYRGGKYVQVLKRMLDNLPAQTVSNGTDEATDLSRPLATINIREHSDWAVALLHAWAAVTEVLSFYEERIVNEGYLRTATEPRSVLELARMVGYELQPGLAAGTHLAFTVLIGKGEPPRHVTLPRVAVQSVPAPGNLPQIFETSEEFVARSDWNALNPADTSSTAWPPLIRRGEKSARLSGTLTGLLPGAVILVMEDQPRTGSPQRRWLLTALKTVQVDQQRGYTLITWENELGIDWSSGTLRDPQVFVLRKQAALWGYTQGGVYFSPIGQTNWSPISIGLPHVPVYCIGQSATGAALFVGTSKGLFCSTNHGEIWQPLAVGLVQKEVFALAISEKGQLLAGTGDGGIYLSQDNGANWRVMSGEEVVIPPTGLARLLPHPNPPLPKTNVRTLATSVRGSTSNVIAGTDNGVFISTDQGKTWQATNGDLPKTDAKTGSTSVVAWALAVTQEGKGEIYAGTDAGVLHIRRGHSGLFVAAVIIGIALIVAALLGGANLAEILDNLGQTLIQGALRFVQGSLQQLSNLLPALSDVAKSLPKEIAWAPLTSLQRSLIKDPALEPTIVFLTNVLLIALALGIVIFVSQFLKRRLSQLPTFSLGTPVHALVVGATGQLFAGTENGVYRSNDTPAENFLQRVLRRLSDLLLGDLTRRWQLVSADLTSKDVRALTVGPQGELLAGTQDGVIFRLRDNGASWEKFDEGLSLKSVQAVKVMATGCFAVGVPIDSPIDKHWSYFQLNSRQVDLDKVYADILPESWMVLRQGEQTCAPYQVRSAATVDSLEASKPGKFTRVEVEQAEGLAAFDRLTTVVLAQSEPLTLYADIPVEKDALQLDRFVPGLQPGHKLIVSGKRLRARVVDQSDSGRKLVSDDGFQAVPLTPGDLYQVVHVEDTAQENNKQWRLKDRNGFTGSIELALDAVCLQPAADNDETVSELVAIRSVDANLANTTIQLEPPLANVYDRSTVIVYGNVVPATHGQTVTDEMLGTSETMKASQHFLLKQQPLTMTSAATASGMESSLTVLINGVKWDEVPALYGEPRDHRAYMIRRDAKGNTVVIFGDGKESPGIPSGTEQITATYRIGLGRAGNVPAGSLNLLQGVVAGSQGAVSNIKAVTNPVAATGGTDPETMDEARWRAPQPLRHLQRIVSLSDYEDFAATFAGIGRAKAAKITGSGNALLHLTIAGAAGEQVPSESDLYHDLITAIETYRAAPTPLRVDSFEPLYFNVNAKLVIEPAQSGRADAILADATSALLAAFSFARQGFGQPVAASNVIAVLQNIRGVVGVELISFHVRDDTPQLHASLEAQLARSGPAGLRPAQMLIINPDPHKGIIVEIQP